MKAPTVAVITLHPTGGGIAVVSNLLWRVFQQHWDTRARLVTLMDREAETTTFLKKARFALDMTAAEVFGQTDWIMFSHLALAQVQQAVPGRLRCRYGVFLHGIEAWRQLSAQEQRVLTDADLRVANSHYTAARVMDMYPDIGHVDACPLGLLPAEREPPSTETDLPALGAHAVLVVGRMVGSERYKGHDQLIDAWPRIVARVPDAQLVIVGSGDDVARLQQRTAANAVDGSVIFTGFVTRPALDALYKRASVFALPSRGEGFGLVYLEAMAHRVPCVGSIHDAASEVIVDGDTGILVDQHDIPGISDTLATLLLDEPRRRAMGDAGYARMMREFTFDCFSDRLSGLLERHLVTSRSVAVES